MRARSGTAFHLGLLAPLVLILFAPSCAEMELLTGNSRGGPGPPPSGSLSVSFIDVGQGDGVLVQAGGESYLIDAGRPEEGPSVVDFLRSRGVEELDGIVVSNPDADHIGGFLDVFDAFPVETVSRFRGRGGARQPGHSASAAPGSTASREYPEAIPMRGA